MKQNYLMLKFPFIPKMSVKIDGWPPRRCLSGRGNETCSLNAWNQERRW